MRKAAACTIGNGRQGTTIDIRKRDGSLVRADENQNEDLYWAIRGGGGNFGVVTSLTMKLSPASMVAAGPITVITARLTDHRVRLRHRTARTASTRVLRLGGDGDSARAGNGAGIRPSAQIPAYHA